MVINQWGPALLVCFSVLVGMLYNNSRLTDLSRSLNARMDDQGKAFNARIDDQSKSLSSRLEDLRDVLRAEAAKNQSELLGKFAELDHRIEKLEAPRIK